MRKIHRSVGKSHYYFDTVDTVRPGIFQIQQLEDEETAQVTDRPIRELQTLETADADMQSFLDEADKHCQTVLNIHMGWRDHLNTIMQDKFA